MPVSWFVLSLALPLSLINSLRAYFLPCLSPFLALTYNYTQTLTQTLYHALSYSSRLAAAPYKKSNGSHHRSYFFIIHFRLVVTKIANLYVHRLSNHLNTNHKNNLQDKYLLFHCHHCVA